MTAGRPRLYPSIMSEFSANLTPKHIEMAKLIGDGNCSKGIRIALLRHGRTSAVYAQARWDQYLREISRSVVQRYAQRKLSIRITISKETREIATGCADFVCEGIRVTLELYGWNNDCDSDPDTGCAINKIDVDLVNKLDIIRRGLYKTND